MLFTDRCPPTTDNRPLPSETSRLGVAMQLDAQWITGFVDGEGCFHISLNPHPEMKTGFQVLPEFTVVQHKRDAQILHALKAYFGCGVVRTNHGDRLAYRVRGQEHLQKRIIPFFEKHVLKSKKRTDFEKFRTVLLMMERGEHLEGEGLAEIRRIVAQMNRASHDKVQPPGKPGGTN